MNKTRRLMLLAFSTVLPVIGAAESLRAQADEKSEALQALEKAKDKLVDDTYLLRYKFKSGDILRWKVLHTASTETTIQGNTQTSKSRSLSTKIWTVQDVNDEGEITFEHSVADMDMWQHVSGRPEVRYNSRDDETPPPEYVQAAETLGKPLATVTINALGMVVDRDANKRQLRLGLGQIAVPLPEEPIKVGTSWHISDQIQLREKSGTVKQVKTRLRYTLESVKTGVATIRVRTEVLTPIRNPALKSQLVQELTDGLIKFDVDAGNVISKEINWNESVVGFNGAGSNMIYRARFMEELLPVDQKTALLPKASDSK